MLNLLKKFIVYQKLLLNSTPPLTLPTLFNGFLYCLAIIIIVSMQIFLFFGNTMTSNTFLPVILPIIIVWVINRLFYGDQRLFETVPVSRKYVALNIFSLSIVMLLMITILGFSSMAIIIGIIIGSLYLINPPGFNPSPAEIINTPKGYILMLFILVIILFVGVAITLIKNKKLRLFSFAGFAVIGYGLLTFLKFNIPIAPGSDKVEFLESFSIMPQANTILICVAIATVIISITSVFMGLKLYVGKSINQKYR